MVSVWRVFKTISLAVMARLGDWGPSRSSFGLILWNYEFATESDVDAAVCKPGLL